MIIDCHKEMTKFHDDEVTLSKKQQDDMRERRDVGRDRLKNGLEDAGNPQFQEMQSQGSYSMRTMVQDADNDYDIDDGAYFAPEDLPSGPLAARQRVCNALADDRFNKPAIVKRNCVRQAYSEGYHIDIPVYRITKDKDGNSVYELASGNEWVQSDARAVTAWFNGRIGELNSGEKDGSQLRRITKLTKKFARRPKWKDKTTSGICLTKLIVDHFQENSGRDDKALRETWQAIDNQLQCSTEINHPVLLSENLASENNKEVVFFHDCLRDALKELEVLDGFDCTHEQASKAWDAVFDTTFFTKQIEKDKSEQVMKVTSVDVARRHDGGGRFG